MTTHSESIGALAAAIAKAQGEIENATKNAQNPHFRSKYADLAEVINTVRPVFAKHGIAVTQCPSYEAGLVSVTTILMHSSGEWLQSICSAPVGKQDAQGVGSCITYCRRYSLAAMAGISQEDDDGNSAIGKPESPPSAPPPAKVNLDTLYELAAKVAAKEQCDSDTVITKYTKNKFTKITDIEKMSEPIRNRLMSLLLDATMEG